MAESKKTCEMKLRSIDQQAKTNMYKYSKFDSEWFPQLSLFENQLSKVSGSASVNSSKDTIKRAKDAVAMFAQNFFVPDSRAYITKIDFYALYMAVLPGVHD